MPSAECGIFPHFASLKNMDHLYPILRRQRRALAAATEPDARPVVTVCPHCGRSSGEPVSGPDAPTVPAKSVPSAPPKKPKT
jgi:hypothetical protein